MSNTFFTSDFHFGHANIIKYSARPFANTDEMDTVLIDNLNKDVKSEDTLYFLGDFLFGMNKEPRAIEYRRRIHRKNIVLIFGNHDEVFRKNKDLAKHLFSDCYDMLETHVNKKRITLNHFSMNIWNKSHHNAWHLYGHSHGTLPDNPNSLSFDCGVDTEWPQIGHKKYTPYHFDEVNSIMTKHKVYQQIDHHGEHTNA